MALHVAIKSSIWLIRFLHSDNLYLRMWPMQFTYIGIYIIYYKLYNYYNKFMHLDLIKSIYPTLNYIVQILIKPVTTQASLEMNTDRTNIRINNWKSNFILLLLRQCIYLITFRNIQWLFFNKFFLSLHIFNGLVSYDAPMQLQ